MNGGLTQELNELGLDPNEIERHAERIRSIVNGGHPPLFKVADTCRLENFGILPPDWLEHSQERSSPRSFVAFVPAAGAASRYVAPFTPLAEALKSKSEDGFKAALAKLRSDGALEWGLPSHVRRLLASNAETLPAAAETATLLDELTAPKALMPCTRDGFSFIAVKSREHEALPQLAAQAFVTPPGREEEFAAALPDRTSLPSRFFAQGPAMSTIRFDAQGEPVREADGRLSTVPAGHGTLVGLLPEVGRAFPEARAVFIRNIDNVMGTSADVRAATTQFLNSYAHLLDAIVAIREALAHSDLEKAGEEARSLIARARLAPLGNATRAEIQRYPADEAALWELVLRLFQMTPQQIQHFNFNRSSQRALQAIFARPVNVLGQVPNSGKDIGGTPVFVETNLGLQKICLELPHAAEDDVRDFLANPRKATHFNPVFACAEIVADARVYDDTAQPLWILASKTYRGRPVLYHETVLYELLGNNLLANALFVEVPRSVFHPHKTPADSAGKNLSDWISQ